jgi:hypothetical protein
MTLETAAQLATAISVIIAVVTLVAGIRIYKRQINAQVFLEYTRRYEEIMRSFPNKAWATRLDLENVLPEPSEELSLSVLR